MRIAKNDQSNIDMQMELDALKKSLRSHRQVDAVRALRELIHQGIANYNDGADPIGDKRDARVSLRSCVDIVRAVQDVIDEPTGCMEDKEANESNRYDPSTPDQEYVLCVWPDYDGTSEARSYRYWDYKEAMEDADKFLHDASNGSKPMVTVAKVLATSQITKSMVRV